MKGPNEDECKQGGKLVLQIEPGRNDSPGRILDDSGVILWRYQTLPRRHIWSPLNLFRKPEFLLTDPQGKEVLKIRRNSRFPTGFEMIQNDLAIARIVRRSMLRNKYSLEFKGGPGWTFRMPLFTVDFGGKSTGGNLLWVRVGPSKMQWNVLLQPGEEKMQLLAAGLAFIHREWWCYS